MSKRSILFVVAILFFFALVSAARPDSSLVEAKEKGAEDVGVEAISCEGVDEEECLVRRSLQAHIDYIYNQAHLDYIYTQAANPTPIPH